VGLFALVAVLTGTLEEVVANEVVPVEVKSGSRL